MIYIGIYTPNSFVPLSTLFKLFLHFIYESMTINKASKSVFELQAAEIAPSELRLTLSTLS